MTDEVGCEKCAPFGGNGRILFLVHWSPCECVAEPTYEPVVDKPVGEPIDTDDIASISQQEWDDFFENFVVDLDSVWSDNSDLDATENVDFDLVK